VRLDYLFREVAMYRSLALMIAIPVLAVLLSGCSDSYEDNIVEQTAVYEQVTVLLSGIVDTATLDAALPQLAQLNRKSLGARALGKSIGQPDEERRRELLEEYKSRTRAAGERRGEEMGRLVKVLSEADMGRLIDAIKDMDPED
jgi:hypothetical protein